MQEQMINKFITSLDGKLSIKDIRTVKEKMLIYFIDYELVKKSTELAVVDIPYNELKTYLFSRSVEGLSKRTLQLYKATLQGMIDTINKPIDKIKTEDIRYYLYICKSQRRISDYTLEQRRIHINTFFTWLVDNDYLVKNPCKAIKPIKGEIHVREPLTPMEMEQLRNVCTTLREKAIVEFFYSTACRVSEIANVKIFDVNFKTNEVKLFGKGKKERFTFLSTRAILALNNYLNSLNYTPTYIFGNPKGTHDKISIRAFERLIHNLGVRAEIQSPVFPHRIRHTSATDAIDKGMKLEECSSWLGHESIETTQIYVKTSKNNVKNSHSKYIV